VILAAVHGWRSSPREGFDWIEASDDLPSLLLEAMEPLSGLQFAGTQKLNDQWSSRMVEASGIRWVVLSRISAVDALPDGRPLRIARHLVLDHPIAGTLPGGLLYEDRQRPLVGGGGLGDDTTSEILDRGPKVDWHACGGDWTQTIAARVAAGDPVRVIFPSTHDVLEWWCAIESAIGTLAWQRTVLLGQLPSEDGADVVFAVEGSPCADALRASGRIVLDLAASPAQPPTDEHMQTTGDVPEFEAPSVAPDVELTPGGPSFGLGALGVLALLLLGGAIWVVVSSMNAGTAP
jgi:hypothetical protein